MRYLDRKDLKLEAVAWKDPREGGAMRGHAIGVDTDFDAILAPPTKPAASAPNAVAAAGLGSAARDASSS